MMSNFADMSTPVTRGELKEELDQFRAELRAEIRQAIAPLATRVELETWGGALLARIQSSEHGLKEMINETRQLQAELQATRLALQAQLQATRRELQEDLARHAGALYESMSALITAHDDKYADLPPRVKRLEAAVFEPEPR